MVPSAARLHTECVRVDDFDYDLPAERIAQRPAAERDGARMLCMARVSGTLQDAWFRELPERLRSGDLLVVNESRVLPARLWGRRPGDPPAARPIEVLLSQPLAAGTWRALVRPARRLPLGTAVIFPAEGETALRAEVVGAGAFGERDLRFEGDDEIGPILERIGHVPLPPYIHRPRAGADDPADRARYQTVYARAYGSVAAPTAGMHFTPAILDALAAKGVERVAVNLAVGLGTFQPVRTDEVEAHRMHSETYEIPANTAAAVERARREKRRVVAVGTTALRALEAAAKRGQGEVIAGAGETALFLYPGREIHIVNGLLTNFHVPRSTLLMLVAAFAGREAILHAYQHAVAERYRFLSYGDCMLIL